MDICKLTSQLALINRDGLTSAEALGTKIEKAQENINEAQLRLAELQKLNHNLKAVIEKADTFFNADTKKLDAMQQLKLAVAKEAVEQYGIAGAEDVEKLRAQYIENEKAIGILTEKIPVMQQSQSQYVELMRTYEDITTGDYIAKLVAQEVKNLG